MTTLLNVNEATVNFSNVFAAVENELASTKIDPLLSRVVLNGDPCENDTDDWENA